MKARLIRITPQTTKSGTTFFNYGWVTREPIGKVLEGLQKQGLVEASVVGELAAAGLAMDKPAIFTTAENEQNIPDYVVRHIFDIDNLTLVPARNEDKTLVLHSVGDSEGQPCLNGARAGGDLYPVYTYVERGGSEVRGLPPPPSAA